MATLDELQAQLAALTQRVNEITAPPDDYYTHRFSGEEIDNAVGRIAATEGSGAITAGDIGAAPNGFGFGDNANGYYNNSGEEQPGLDYLKSLLDGMANGIFKCFTFNDYYTLGVLGTTRTVHCKLYKFAPNNALAEFRTTNDGGVTITGYRGYGDGGWQPIELLNPLMRLGVEYRTTERHNGKPVYTKLVDCGAMPNNTAKLVAYTDDVNARPISVTGTWDNGTITMPGENGTSGFPTQLQSISLLNRNILIVTHANRSSSTANATVKYWKTTD